MNDKELLELAAKAAGYTQVSASYHSDDDGFPTAEFWYLHIKDLYDGKSGDSCVWNPLTDDGDALRLAVKLDLFTNAMFLSSVSSEAVKNNGDWCAATRRAIVRAAAEIGKSL